MAYPTPPVVATGVSGFEDRGRGTFELFGVGNGWGTPPVEAHAPTTAHNAIVQSLDIAVVIGERAARRNGAGNMLETLPLWRMQLDTSSAIQAQ